MTPSGMTGSIMVSLHALPEQEHIAQLSGV